MIRELNLQEIIAHFWGNYERVLVCGGRGFGYYNPDEPGPVKRLKARREYKFISSVLDIIAEDILDPTNMLPRDNLTIIEGGAKGVDRAASDWALITCTPLKTYKADWATHGKYAGHLRNTRMLKDGNPDLVVAFPGGKGTANMIKQATEAGVEVLKVIYEGV